MERSLNTGCLSFHLICRRRKSRRRPLHTPRAQRQRLNRRQKLKKRRKPNHGKPSSHRSTAHTISTTHSQTKRRGITLFSLPLFLRHRTPLPLLLSPFHLLLLTKNRRRRRHLHKRIMQHCKQQPSLRVSTPHSPI